jgi:hypothetical protein
MIVFITPYVLDTPDEIAAESMRRKRALNIKDMWERGWSDSKMATPSREDARKQERAERKARRDQRRARKETPIVETQEIPDASPSEMDTGANSGTIDDVQMDTGMNSGTIDDVPDEQEQRKEESQGPAQDEQKGDIQTLINERSARWSKSLDAIDRLTPRGKI